MNWNLLIADLAQVLQAALVEVQLRLVFCGRGRWVLSRASNFVWSMVVPLPPHTWCLHVHICPNRQGSAWEVAHIFSSQDAAYLACTAWDEELWTLYPLAASWHPWHDTVHWLLWYQDICPCAACMCKWPPLFCSKLRSSPHLTGQYWLPCPVQTCRTWVYEVKDGRYRKSTSTGAIWEAIQYRDGNVQELSRTFKNYILKARSVHCDTNEYRHSSPQSQQLFISDRALAPALMIVTSRPNRKILPKKSGVTPVHAAFPPNWHRLWK